MNTWKYPSEWYLAEGITVINGVLCLFVPWENAEYLEKLPTEFFSHELLVCNPDNNDEIVEFAKQWGMLFHPLRIASAFDPFSLLRKGPVDKRESYDTFRSACAKTDHAAKLLIEEKEPSFMQVVSLDEAKLAVSFMQEQTRAIFAKVEGNATMRQKRLIGQINAARRIDCLISPISIDGAAAMFANGGRSYLPIEHQNVDFILANAIANQIADTALSDAEWKRCAWCGHPFKEKRARTDWGRKQSTSIYCCDKCLQCMKDYRREKQKAPDWWTPEQAIAEFKKGKRNK